MSESKDSQLDPLEDLLMQINKVQPDENAALRAIDRTRRAVSQIDTSDCTHSPSPVPFARRWSSRFLVTAGSIALIVGVFALLPMSNREVAVVRADFRAT